MGKGHSQLSWLLKISEISWHIDCWFVEQLIHTYSRPGTVLKGTSLTDWSTMLNKRYWQVLQVFKGETKRCESGYFSCVIKMIKCETSFENRPEFTQGLTDHWHKSIKKEAVISFCSDFWQQLPGVTPDSTDEKHSPSQTVPLLTPAASSEVPRPPSMMTSWLHIRGFPMFNNLRNNSQNSGEPCT